MASRPYTDTHAEQTAVRTTAATALPQENDQPDHAYEHDHAHGHEQAQTCAWPEALRIGLVALVAVAVWWHVWEPYSAVSVLGGLGLAMGGWPIVKEAVAHIAQRRMTMELSMSLAIVAAAALGEFFTALVMTLFVLVAEVLEGMTVQRGRRAIHDLLEGLPRVVSVRRAGAVQVVAADAITAGEAILVNPGGHVPVDGVVIAGHSCVDESRLTGESMPVEKMAGMQVYAGSLNQSGALEVRTERIGRDTSYGKIIEAVERAEHARAPVERLADRLASYLVYCALGAALLTFLITRDVRCTIAVVIVAGACGIAAGTPLAILGSIGRAARLGVIVKGGVHLETLGQVDMVVLDKTGTLTFGQPEVQRLVPVAGVSADEVLEAAATAEVRSEHPLGQAIVAYARAKGSTVVEPQRFASTPGKGIAAAVDGADIVVGNRAWMADCQVDVPADFAVGLLGTGADVLIARNGHLVGAIAIAETIRPEAQRAIAGLTALGVRTLLLTGDTRAVAEAVGRQLGLSGIAAGLLPEQKRARVQHLVATGRIVAMVGDGVNDAPALAAASVGVAMGSGTDVTRESADVVLLGNDLGRFVETVVLARRTRRIIWQNFAGTLAVDALGIGLAACGLLGPLCAAFLHVASELTFILNSARLLSTRRGVGTPPRGSRVI